VCAIPQSKSREV